MKLKWLVFYHNVNRQEIVQFNIFDHGGFSKDVQRDLKQIRDRDKFAESLRMNLSYYFRSRAEYEVVISPWCVGKSTPDIKVDIYTQVMLNFDIFADYVWTSFNKI